MNLPKWVWFIIGFVVVLIVLALLKVNITMGGHGFAITQGIVS